MSLARYSTIKKVFIKNIKKNKKKYNLLVLKKIEKKNNCLRKYILLLCYHYNSFYSTSLSFSPSISSLNSYLN